MIRRLIAVALVLAGTAFAAGAEQMSPREIWPQAAGAARDGDLNRANEQRSNLVESGKAFGIRTFPLYATAAAGIARTASDENNAELAKWATDTARALDPKSPAVKFALADVAASKGNWVEATKLGSTGLLRLASNYRTSVLSLANLLVVGAVTIVITAAIFAIALFFRYARAASHDLRELLAARLHGGSVTVLAFALLFLPLFLWLGPFWLMFYWFAIFFAYASVKERIAIVTLLLLLATTPVAFDVAAHLTAGVDSPVLLAAASSEAGAYQPESLRRLQELASVIPDDATIQMLLGNAQVFEGNEQQAETHYRKSAEIRASAGAHVNLGNLHFMQNDFAAAVTEYERAQKLDGNLAIAWYNDSVARGELYKFDEQGQKLEQAKKLDRGLIEGFASNPPSQKVVMYSPSMRDAWTVAAAASRRPAARALFANYSELEVVRSILNPITVGSVLSLLAALGLWSVRRKNGVAGSCIKCGRTYCYRCKSARESATYCTQCIHIYLKRDGVSLETKRTKLEEVSNFHAGLLRRNRILATFLPGSGQVLEARTFKGVIGTFLVSFFVVFGVLVGRLAPIIAPVGASTHLVLRVAAGVLAAIVWLMLAIAVYRRKSAAV